MIQGILMTSLLVFCLFSGILAPDTAYAYLDPGTGSMILQAVIAGVLGSFFAIKMYWRRIMDFVKKTKD